MPLTDQVRKEIFTSIKEVMEKQCPPMVASKDKEGVYELMGNKPVPYGSKKTIVPGMYFCSVVARKDMISFYFFPIYMQQKEFIDLIPTMKKYLKGKSCFNFKKTEEVNANELAALLKTGVRVWKKMGYMN